MCSSFITRKWRISCNAVPSVRWFVMKIWFTCQLWRYFSENWLKKTLIQFPASFFHCFNFIPVSLNFVTHPHSSLFFSSSFQFNMTLIFLTFLILVPGICSRRASLRFRGEWHFDKPNDTSLLWIDTSLQWLNTCLAYCFLRTSNVFRDGQVSWRLKRLL